MTRALGYLARGELGAAVTLHPLAPLVAAEIVAGWLVLGLVVHGKGSPPGRWWLERCLAASGFFLLAVWMGRLAIGDLNAIRP